MPGTEHIRSSWSAGSLPHDPSKIQISFILWSILKGLGDMERERRIMNPSPKWHYLVLFCLFVCLFVCFLSTSSNHVSLAIGNCFATKHWLLTWACKWTNSRRNTWHSCLHFTSVSFTLSLYHHNHLGSQEGQNWLITSLGWRTETIPKKRNSRTLQNRPPPNEDDYLWWWSCTLE
jgi:hypothetical protein